MPKPAIIPGDAAEFSDGTDDAAGNFFDQRWIKLIRETQIGIRSMRWQFRKGQKPAVGGPD
jgi:hypothetical protein